MFKYKKIHSIYNTLLISCSVSVQEILSMHIQKNSILCKVIPNIFHWLMTKCTSEYKWVYPNNSFKKFVNKTWISYNPITLQSNWFYLLFAAKFQRSSIICSSQNPSSVYMVMIYKYLEFRKWHFLNLNFHQD